jgi:hypothetical protein
LGKVYQLTTTNSSTTTHNIINNQLINSHKFQCSNCFKEGFEQPKLLQRRLWAAQIVIKKALGKVYQLTTTQQLTHQQLINSHQCSNFFKEGFEQPKLL